MMEGKTVLAVIPARGGSKRLPRKNLLSLGDKPLLAWTAAAAAGARYLDRVILSSDDAEIIRLGRSLGLEAPFVRPAALSGDAPSAAEAALHALEALPGYDYVVLLQPTSPFRVAADIDAVLETLWAGRAPACVSVAPAPVKVEWLFAVGGDGLLSPWPSPAPALPEGPGVCVLNGAVYAAEKAFFLASRTFLCPSTLGYVMPPERSVDIDTESDLLFAQSLLRRPERQAGPAPDGKERTGASRA